MIINNNNKRRHFPFTQRDTHSQCGESRQCSKRTSHDCTRKEWTKVIVKDITPTAIVHGNGVRVLYFLPTNYDNDNKCAVEANISSLFMKLVSSLKWVHIKKAKSRNYGWLLLFWSPLRTRTVYVIRKPVVRALLQNNLLFFSPQFIFSA